ncbi:MAG: phytoene dehydrogenase [Alphaproteobacteria bacterium]|nr:phytoene dehydrogenase [Alphaproteobacteria bacterium]
MLHIVGAGLAGLACAVDAVVAGLPVRLYEAAPQAGGRCRSFHDSTLDRVIDNGNHLILGANRAAFRYLDRIGARDRLTGIEPSSVPFLDLASGESWRVSAGWSTLGRALSGRGVLVPGGTWSEFARLWRLFRAPENAIVVDALGPEGALYWKLWIPLSVAALNTAPDEAAASLLWPVVARTLLAGSDACRPYIAREGLGAALIDPAVDWLAKRGANLATGMRVNALNFDGKRLAALGCDGQQIALAAGDAVVLAVPPANANALVPGLGAPEETRAIVNTHFRLERPAALPFGAPLLGLLGGEAEWLFLRGDVLSVTVSAADAIAAKPAEEIAALMWRDVTRAIGQLGALLPPVRVIKEKRATPAQTPEFARSRLPAKTRWQNLFLAGDWTATGLPATIEGAIASGQEAALQVVSTQGAGVTSGRDAIRKDQA